MSFPFGKKICVIPTLIFFQLLCLTASSQRLQALHGSPYAGSLAKDYNPAGILNSPDRWDLTVLGLQYRNITNGISFDNISLLKQTDSIEWHSDSGYARRYIHAANTINLFHFRYRLNARSAFSFGVNVRSYLHGQTSSFNINDTMNTMTDFLMGNLQTEKYFGNAQTSNWMEYSFAYSRVIKSNELGRLQGGIELRYMKALTGAYGRLQNGRLSNQTVNGQNYFLITDMNGEYGYSANTDELNSSNSHVTSDRTPFQSFMKTAATNFGLNAGIEYVRYWDDMGEGPKTGTDYNWKLSVALLDIGSNKYNYSTNSFKFSGVDPNTYTSQLDQALDNNVTLEKLRDSIQSWSVNYSVPTGSFHISNPTRLLVNFDKSFQNNFSLNAEAQLNFNSTRSMERVNTRETSAITVTPRWETKSLGAYMPVQYTTEGNFWIGLGLKAGPLVLGLENMGWLLSKKSMPNGGFYLALQIRPGKSRERDAMPCPE